MIPDRAAALAQDAADKGKFYLHCESIFPIIRQMTKCKVVSMRKFMNIVKALADENRVRVLMALRDRELCVCDIIEMLGLAPSTVSKHLSILYQAGLLDSRKEGRWVHYRLASKDAPIEAQQAVAWVSNSLATDKKVQEDTIRLMEITTKRKHELKCADETCLETREEIDELHVEREKECAR